MSQQKMRRFWSKYKRLKLVMEPTYHEVINGVPKVVYGRMVEFDDKGMLETSDKKVIDFIRNHRRFGVDIVEDAETKGEGEQVQQAAG